MGADLSRIDFLARRQIEAMIAGPLIRAFIEEVGQEKALAIVGKVIRSLAFESGVQLAKQMGDNSMASLAKGMRAWRLGGNLEMEELGLSETRFEFNVRKCKFAEIYKELGMADLGPIISCSRDFELVAGFNPKMKLFRTKTIMEGHDHCDFRVVLQPENQK